MLYAKVIYTGVADYKHASARQTVICADRFDFLQTDNGTPIMEVYRGSEMVDTIVLQGDVWVMNESGRQVSQYAVPFSALFKDENGEADTRVSVRVPKSRARAHQ